MTPLLWDPQARRIYEALMDPHRGLPALQREQLDKRLDSLRQWPPSKWFELRDQRDGTVTFRLESDQFLEILGLFEGGNLKITHLNIRVRRRR